MMKKTKLAITLVLSCLLVFMISSLAFADQVPWSSAKFRPSAGQFYFNTELVAVSNVRLSTANLDYWNSVRKADYGAALEFEFRPIYTTGDISNPNLLWNKTTSGTANWPQAYYEFDTDDVSLCSKSMTSWSTTNTYSASMNLTKKSGITDSDIKARRFLFELERGEFVLFDALPLQYTRYNVSSGAGQQMYFAAAWVVMV